MTYIAYVSGTLDDLPLAVCKTFDEAKKIARDCMLRPEASTHLKKAMDLMSRDTSCLVAACVATHGDDGSMHAFDVVWGNDDTEGEVRL